MLSIEIYFISREKLLKSTSILSYYYYYYYYYFFFSFVFSLLLFAITSIPISNIEHT
jgi:hypothetical protein